MHVHVIGAGGWGTALAAILAGNGLAPLLWTREEQVANTINSTHENPVFLPGVQLPKAIRATSDIEAALSSPVILLAVPTQYIRSVVSAHRELFQGKIVINAAKGIERHTSMRVSQILAEAAGVPPELFGVLTGPSHAEEVAIHTPTTVVTASVNPDIVRIAQEAFTTTSFRVYSSSDVIGAEVGGAVKNVIAIAAGIVDGLAMGDNTKAALITRGLAEITRLGVALGADARTFSGLSGLGDLIVTCGSRHSRNRHVGEEIGRGKTLEAITGETQMVAEGVWTTESVVELSHKIGVEMPIAEQVRSILFQGKSPRQAIIDLMTRESRAEH